MKFITWKEHQEQMHRFIMYMVNYGVGRREEYLYVQQHRYLKEMNE